MYRVLPACLLLFVIYFSACKQEAYKTPPPSPSTSYLPQTYGSTWTYRDSVFGEPTDTIPVYGVKIDTLTYTINGRTTDWNGLVCYNVAIASQLHGNSVAYYYAINHIYLIFDTTIPMGFLSRRILIDNVPVGYTWITTPDLYEFYNGSPIRSINTIQAVDTTRIVQGYMYTHVIHTSLNFQTNVKNAGYKNIAYFDYYTAKGVGVIEKDAYYYGALNEKETLLHSVIK
jgi:hypothetical protein